MRLPLVNLRVFLDVVFDKSSIAAMALTACLSACSCVGEARAQESSPTAAAPNANAEALWAAARKGDVAGIELALKAGVDANAKTAYGATALSFAVDRGHLEAVRYLLSNHADPNNKDTFYNATPMAWASMGERYEIQKALVLAGAKDMDLALPAAVKNQDLEMVERIANSGIADRQTVKLALRSAEEKGQTHTGSRIVTVLRDALDKYFPRVTVAPEKLQAYAGSYQAESGTRLDITLTDGSLSMQLGANPKQTLDAESQTEFSSSMGKLAVQSEAGAVSSIKLDFGSGSTQTYRRLSIEEAEKLAKLDSEATASANTENSGKDFPQSSPESMAADLAISSSNWGQFRGNAARGIADGQNAPARWNHETSENIAWKAPIPGLGHSCPVVWDRRVLVTSAISGKEADLRIGLYGDVTSVDDDSEHEFITVCLDAENGHQLWRKTACKRVPSVKRHLKSTHANCTVATNGQFVVASFASEGLYCYTMDGQLVWQKDLGKLDSGWFFDRDYQWQFGSSPIIHNDKLILQCDIQENSFLAMLDLATGQEIWRASRNEIPSWSTPTVVSTPGGLQIVTNATRAARGYDFATGKELWSIGRNSEIVVPTPLAAHGLIYISSGYRPIQPVYAIRLDALGDLTLPEGKRQSEYVTWSETSGGPYMPTPIVYGDYLYICSNSGILTCYQAKTGSLVYKKRLPMKGNRSFVSSPVASDGKLYFTSEEGETAVIKAGPIFELIANNSCGESCLTTPAISRGTLYIRGQQHVFAIRETQ